MRIAPMLGGTRPVLPSANIGRIDLGVENGVFGNAFAYEA